MFRRKILIHLVFWFIFLSPALLDLKWPLSKGETALALNIVLIAPPFFYWITEWVMPRLMRAGQHQYVYWLIAFAGCLLWSWFHMKTETWIGQNFFEQMPSQPGYIQYFVGMFWFMAIAVGMSFMQYWYKSQLQEKEMRNLQIKAELNLLRHRINPHFLFNTLNSIYAFALEKSDKTPEIILRLSGLMRYMLKSEDIWVPLSEELAYIDDYIALERLRLDREVSIRLNIEGEAEGLYIAPMLLLPFIENSFKHGISTSSMSRYVEIVIHIDGDNLYMYVENSKPPTSAAQERKGSDGVGLSSVKRRLELLYGPDKYHLEIENMSDKYRVNLYLKLQKRMEHALLNSR